MEIEKVYIGEVLSRTYGGHTGSLARSFIMLCATPVDRNEQGFEAYFVNICTGARWTGKVIVLKGENSISYAAFRELTKNASGTYKKLGRFINSSGELELDSSQFEKYPATFDECYQINEDEYFL